MILFESMLEKASKNNVEIDRGRGIANGSLMLVAGMSSCRIQFWIRCDSRELCC